MKGGAHHHHRIRPSHRDLNVKESVADKKALQHFQDNARYASVDNQRVSESVKTLLETIKQRKRPSMKIIESLDQWHIINAMTQLKIRAMDNASELTDQVWAAKTYARNDLFYRDRIQEVKEWKTNQLDTLRSMLNPSVYMAKRKSTVDMRYIEVAACRYLMSPRVAIDEKNNRETMLKVQEVAVAGITDTSEKKKDVKTDEELYAKPRLNRELQGDLSDAFYWLNYANHLFEQYPLEKVFANVKKDDVARLRDMLLVILHDRPGTKFEQRGRTFVEQQSVLLGARHLFKRKRPAVGDLFTPLEVIIHCFANNRDERESVMKQTTLDMRFIGTEYQDPNMKQSTVDAWMLMAWNRFISSFSSKDFIDEYCIQWYYIGEYKSNALLGCKKVDDTKHRLPIIINLGENQWYVQTPNRIFQGAEPPTLLSALILWAVMVKDPGYGSRFEDGSVIPNWDIATKRYKAIQESKYAADRTRRLKEEYEQSKKRLAEMDGMNVSDRMDFLVKSFEKKSIDDHYGEGHVVRSKPQQRRVNHDIKEMPETIMKEPARTVELISATSLPIKPKAVRNRMIVDTQSSSNSAIVEHLPPHKPLVSVGSGGAESVIAKKPVISTPEFEDVVQMHGPELTPYDIIRSKNPALYERDEFDDTDSKGVQNKPSKYNPELVSSIESQSSVLQSLELPVIPKKRNAY